MSSHLAQLKASYDSNKGAADDFRLALKEQTLHLLGQNSLRPAMPIEHRTKDWRSIALKCDRLRESWRDVTEIWDLVGLRTVFLFPEEAEQAICLFDQSFDIKYRLDFRQKLSPHELGYQAVHLTVQVPPSWSSVPSLRAHLAFKAEIQVRTLSQHNWAVASRLLQYNNQSFAPPSVQRSFFRVAALLEVVDLELDRVQKEREAYRKAVATQGPDQGLNIDLLEALLKKHLPKKHAVPNDDYLGLFVDLRRRRILNAGALIVLIDKHLKQALSNDKMALKEIRSGNSAYSADPEQLKRGVFYTQVGLMQNILNLEFGTGWRKVRKRTKTQSRQ